MENIFGTYESIQLEEMKKVRLMNRIDTKYVTTLPFLIFILKQAKDFYFVQNINGQFMMPYHTLYYDTQDMDMYMEHLRGRKKRQKIRIRSYENSSQSFLEIKNKSNKGRTEKVRIPYMPEDKKSFDDFIGMHGSYSSDRLSGQIENRFSRITLVNKNMTERLTIDIHLRFRHIPTGTTCGLNRLVIIELKRDGNSSSPIMEILREIRVHPAKFSKYCMGMVLTNDKLKYNRFKPRIRHIKKLCDISMDIKF